MADEFHAFLSYNSQDREIAEAIHQRLQQRGLRVFLDQEDIFAGDRWQQALESRAADSACGVVLLGRSGLGNWQRAEVELFLAEHRERGMRIIPVVLPGATIPKQGLLALHSAITLTEELSEDGIRRLTFAITQPLQKFAFTALVVPAASPASQAWLEEIVRPVCRELDIDVRLPTDGGITLWKGIQTLEFVILDLSAGDPGTMYALGLCHAASRPVIAMSRDPEPVADISFGELALLRTNGDLERSRLALKNAIQQLRDNPSAGNALPHAGLFQQLKLIRSTYRDDRRALSLAIRWFRQRDASLNHQIESRQIRIGVTDFERVQEWLFDFIQEGDIMLATCFTDMPEFYFRRDVGSKYFKLNAAIIRNLKVQMYRIFEVSDDVWRRNNILLRELVDMYLDLDCRVSVVRRADIEQSIDRDDFLLICRKDGTPRAAIDFELDTAGITSIAFQFLQPELEEKYRYFKQLEAIAAPHTRPPRRARRTVDEMVHNISELALSITNTNTISYISDASHSDQDIAEYWRGLKGGLIRPADAASDAMQQQLTVDLQARGGRPFEHALILGSTPEARRLAKEFAQRTTVADISEVMYYAMSTVMEREYGIASPHAREEFLLGEWRSLPAHSGPFDLVLAFDAVNMLHSQDVRTLVKQLRLCTRPQACLVMQWAHVPNNPYLQTCRDHAEGTSIRDAFKRWATQAGDGPDGRGGTGIDHHELFARLALSQFQPSDRRLELRPVVTFLTNNVVALDEATEGLALKLQKTYALCNTTLFFHSQLQETVGLKEVAVQRVDSSNDRWTSLFCVGKFALHEDAVAQA